MGRLSTLFYLSPEQQESLKSCIRAHQYVNLGRMMDDLGKRGIEGISRSALHRIASQLREADALLAGPNEGTIITIMERVSGEVRVLKTSSSGLSVATLLEQTLGVSSVS